jgi:hypothetical protein
MMIVRIERVGRVIPRGLSRNSCVIATGGNVDTTRPTLTIITIHTTGQPLQPTHPRIIHRIFGRVGLTIPILVLYLSNQTANVPIIINVEPTVGMRGFVRVVPTFQRHAQAAPRGAGPIVTVIPITKSAQPRRSLWSVSRYPLRFLGSY